ncbi:ParB/RepB/Spo0J family partition protein [Cryobacterium cryoconiti]|uniref:ParB-like N-terminal domain-containing protein n=1 Tax=Cryobacterium cryoconiti TaxID=1259239 RepID=A0A4Y8JS36_9MICO|nr:ParB N-terminal domain-containing protein [Cryobacterium cryoconiti]TFD27484.1 hypothetical protein E3T49_13145 [Cryobacterium cryoconiti]
MTAHTETTKTLKRDKAMTRTIEDVNPGELIIAANVRTETKVGADFVANIRLNGVILPILAERTAEGLLEVIDGQRRTIAAVEAGLTSVPVFVVGDSGDNAARLLTQVTVNDQREGLDEAEHVAAFQQLSLFGVSAADIARKTGTKTTRVQKALDVAANPAAAAVFADHVLTLDQVAALVDFSDDPDAVKTLTKAAAKEPARFDHLVADLHLKRELAAHIEQLRTELVAEGVTILTESLNHYSGTAEGDPAVTRLDRLALPETPTIPLTHDNIPTAHLAGRITGNYSHPTSGYGKWAEIYYFILTEHAHHYTPLEYARPTTERTPEQQTDHDNRIAAQLAEQTHRAALAAAETVRVDWLNTFFQRAKRPAPWEFIARSLTYSGELSNGEEFPPTLLPWIGVHVVVEPASNEHFEAAQLARGHLSENPKTSERLILALVIYNNETNVASSWHQNIRQAAAYLTQLVTWGYGLSEVEQGIVDAAKAEQVSA